MPSNLIIRKGQTSCRVFRLKIREFRPGDYESVAKLWLDAGLGFRLGDDLESVKRKRKRDPDLFLVAVEKGVVVGTVMGAWDGRRGWIYHLGVLPSHQRRGIASKLILELEERMRKKGVSKVNGLVYAWNSVSISFFRENGYKVQTMEEVEKQLVEWKHEMVAPGGDDGPTA
jgi:ribosomal protein S18 acetylase RimI-like enzyme